MSLSGPRRNRRRSCRANHLTIKKAYEHLQSEGLVDTRHGRGTYVTNGGKPLPRSVRCELLNEHVERLFNEARHLGLQPDEVRQLVDRRIQAWEKLLERER